MREWSFEYPEVWLFFGLFLLCQYLYKKVPAPRYFPHLHLFGFGGSVFSFRKLLKYLIAFLLVAAAASPVIVDHRNPGNRNGFDIALCLDSSGSMGETGFVKENLAMSKFDSVKQVVREFILNRRNDNIALVLFGDFAYIASPLTYEKEVLAEFMELQDMALAGKNTAIGDGLVRSIDALKDSRAKTQLVILLTDGKQNAGSVAIDEAVTMAVRHNIRIYTIGIGEDSDTALLTMIAQNSGGRSYFAKDSEALTEVYQAIDTLESSKIKSRDYRVKEHLFFYPAWGGLMLMGLYLYLLAGRRR